jgi:hypothetical protein
LGAVGLAWFLLPGGGFIAWNVIVVPLNREILDNDLAPAYIGARIGIEQGWSHLYSLVLGQPGLNVVVIGGELGWPLSPLPSLIGLAVWLVFMAIPPRPAAHAVGASSS